MNWTIRPLPDNISRAIERLLPLLQGDLNIHGSSRGRSWSTALDARRGGRDPEGYGVDQFSILALHLGDGYADVVGQRRARA